MFSTYCHTVLVNDTVLGQKTTHTDYEVRAGDIIVGVAE